MKLFKTVDEKFAEIGFVNISESKLGVVYERRDNKFDYSQIIHLLHKASGQHIVQSYDPRLSDKENIGNTCVGLTMYEMRLCLKKMKQMGWKPCKKK